MELETLDQAGVGKALQPTLRRGCRAPGVESSVNLARQHVPQAGDERKHLQIERIGVNWFGRLHPLRPAHAVRPVELDQLAIAVSWSRGEARTSVVRRRRPGSRRRLHVLALDLGTGTRALPVWLLQVGQVASAALDLALNVQREALLIDADRDRLGDERRLPPFWSGPAGDRVVLGKMKADIRMAERRQVLDTGTHHV